MGERCERKENDEGYHCSHGISTTFISESINAGNHHPLAAPTTTLAFVEHIWKLAGQTV
jgi:hypothetical protein